MLRSNLTSKTNIHSLRRSCLDITYGDQRVTTAQCFPPVRLQHANSDGRPAQFRDDTALDHIAQLQAVAILSQNELLREHRGDWLLCLLGRRPSNAEKLLVRSGLRTREYGCDSGEV